VAIARQDRFAAGRRIMARIRSRFASRNPLKRLIPARTTTTLLDARPLASGNSDQIGLPQGGASNGTSTGTGSGGGVGEGIGSGIGSGRGPGLGPGSGGGIGGGVYRPGGRVTPPRVITQVKPTYTDDAMLEKIQGTVVLELVVDSTSRHASASCDHSIPGDSMSKRWSRPGSGDSSLDGSMAAPSMCS
jgi:hypothetical protein